MELEQGAIVEGKVSGITKFGAFVTLEGGKSGLVHISEVANSFVSDIREHLQLGQIVKVKVLGISPEGKINLSIKKAEPPAPREPLRRVGVSGRRAPSFSPEAVAAAPASNDQSFEDRLKKFMQESDSRIADNRMYADRNRRSKRHGS